MVIFWSMLGGLGVALPYVYVVTGALKDNYTLGDLANRREAPHLYP